MTEKLPFQQAASFATDMCIQKELLTGLSSFTLTVLARMTGRREKKISSGPQ